jgi:poly-gamma-glutamate synthesis protein (capsule biosynthesis protein)
MKRIILTLACIVIVAAVASTTLTISPAPANVLSGWLSATSSVQIVATGDIMLDRTIRAHHHPDRYYTIAPWFASLAYNADIVIGNLEGPITNRRSVSKHASVGHPNNTRFTFAPESMNFLIHYGFDIVSLGNNHSMDYGVNGVRSTAHHLEKHSIASIGDPRLDAQPYTVTRNGMSLAFIAYNQFGGAPVRAVAKRIRELEQNNDWVIVYSHWGTEYTKTPTPQQQNIARRLATAGADLIVGSHPHVIQPKENVAGTPVYYSLGNFVFDQYFSPRVRCGAVLSLTLTPTKVQRVQVQNAYLLPDRTTQAKHCSGILQAKRREPVGA